MISFSFRPLAGLSCINQSFQIQSMLKILTREFPSPRGVELHKPSNNCRVCIEFCVCFRPLAGLSCINLISANNVLLSNNEFPSPRGVELHKPSVPLVRKNLNDYFSFRPLAGLSCINHFGFWCAGQVGIFARFRPLAGLSCINLNKSGLWPRSMWLVSVPSRG